MYAELAFKKGEKQKNILKNVRKGCYNKFCLFYLTERNKRYCQIRYERMKSGD